MTNNSQYIIKATDNLLADKPMALEYEFNNLEHAQELYRDFLNDTNITDLYLYEYDFSSKQYHLLKY